MLMRLSDRLVFIWAAIWTICHAPREYARLVMLQAKNGVFRIRLAVPLLANEKYHWRKMFDHNPLFVMVTDKAAAKEWVASLNLPFKQPKTLWCGTDAADIPDDVWNTPILIKATHGCQMNVLVPVPPKDREAVIAQANDFLLHDHGARRHQWAYGPVPRQLIAEEWVFPGKDLIELKCYTFGAATNQVFIVYRGAVERTSNWFLDAGGEYIRSRHKSGAAGIEDVGPMAPIAQEAIALSSQLGVYFDHMRIDFMSDGDELILGELTVYNLAGRVQPHGQKVEKQINNLWDLRNSWFLTQPQTGWHKHYAAALRRALDRRATKA